jgi:hypothetical protein
MTKKTFLALMTVSLLAAPPTALAQTGSGASTSSGGRRPTTTAQQGRATTTTEMDQRVPQGFSVVLVVGDLQSGTTSDNVPAAARKALADMKEFLPYKGYRLLDVQWTLCCSRASSTPVVSRLRGADGRDYELSLTTNLDPRHRLGVRFVLRDPSPGTAEVAAEIASASGERSLVAMELTRERDNVEQQLKALRANAQQRHEVGIGGPVEQDREVVEMRRRLGELNIRIAEVKDRARTTQRVGRGSGGSSRALIDTSFTMDIGETVVVGTSRIAGGEKALIALLTAVPQKR